jgi:hypothetical protein
MFQILAGVRSDQFTGFVVGRDPARPLDQAEFTEYTVC